MGRTKKVIALATVTVALLALSVGPAFAGQPEGGCPSGGGFVEKEQTLPPGTKGNTDQLNTSPEQCFKVIENAPQPLKDLIGVDPVEVFIEDVVR